MPMRAEIIDDLLNFVGIELPLDRRILPERTIVDDEGGDFVFRVIAENELSPQRELLLAGGQDGLDGKEGREGVKLGVLEGWWHRRGVVREGGADEIMKPRRWTASNAVCPAHVD